jgi:hypothetical protein
LLSEGFGRLQRALANGPADADALCDHVLGQLVPKGGAGDDVAILVVQTAAANEDGSR